MDETRWWNYTQRLIGSDTAQEAARRAGFDKSAFTRWKKGASPEPAFALKLARAYRGNVLEALVESGLITDEEAGLTVVQAGRREVFDDTSIATLLEVALAKALRLEEPKADDDQ